MQMARDLWRLARTLRAYVARIPTLRPHDPPAGGLLREEPPPPPPVWDTSLYHFQTSALNQALVLVREKVSGTVSGTFLTPFSC